jgi:hypothetical protein
MSQEGGRERAEAESKMCAVWIYGADGAGIPALRPTDLSERPYRDGSLRRLGRDLS